MDQEIKIIIGNEIDFTSKFTNYVNEMRVDLEKKLGISIFHEDDMNYRASQKLIFGLSANWKVCNYDDTSKQYVLDIILSSKGKIYTHIIYEKKGVNEYSEFLGHRSDTVSSSNDIISIYKVLDNKKLKHLYKKDLLEIVPGFLTQLDDLPANLFQVLFTEID